MHKSLLPCTLALLITGPVLADNRQAELDAACDAERQKRLEPLREEMVQECITKEGRDPDECRQFYAEWDGNRGAGRSRLFFDLPECEAALDYQRESNRR